MRTRLIPALFSLAALASAALAQDLPDAEPVPVLVAPFQAKNQDAVGLAALMHGFLEGEVGRHEELRVVAVEDVGSVFDQSAELYLDSCPPGQAVGCALVVGETAGVTYALAGTVEAIGGTNRVVVSIVDVAHAREALSLQLDLGMGDDTAFAAGVARLLVAVARGESGAEADIRLMDDEADPTDFAAVASELSALQSELGEVRQIARREVARPERMTVGDITERMEGDGVKPWERVDMTPRQYLRYKNSGLGLPEFRSRADGRKAQLLLRPTLGFARGPVNGLYYGRYVRSDETLDVVQSVAWQTLTAGSGFLYGASVGYGLLPEVEVGLVGGAVSGRYEVDIDVLTVGEIARDRESETYSNGSWFVGPRVLAALLPTSSVRPVLGGELLLWGGTDVSNHVLPPAELPTFPDPLLVMVSFIPGVELRLSDALDLYAHVPVSAIVAGGAVATYEYGGDYLDGVESPPALGAVSAGLQVGLQVRLLGPRDDSGGLREVEDWD